MRRRHSSVQDTSAAHPRVFGPCIVEDWVSPDEIYPTYERERLQDPAAAIQYVKLTAFMRQLEASQPERDRCRREGIPAPKFDTRVLFRGDYRAYLPLKFEPYEESRMRLKGTRDG